MHLNPTKNATIQSVLCQGITLIRMNVQLIMFYIKDDLVINADHLHCSLPGTNAIDPLWERPLVDVAQLESVTEKH